MSIVPQDHYVTEMSSESAAILTGCSTQPPHALEGVFPGLIQALLNGCEWVPEFFASQVENGNLQQ
jgi:hypothetical protein